MLVKTFLNSGTNLFTQNLMLPLVMINPDLKFIVNMKKALLTLTSIFCICLVSSGQNSFPENEDVLMDNYAIISKGGSSIGFGSGGIGNEDDDITIDVVNDGEFELNRAGVNLFSIGSHILLDRTNSKNIGIGTGSPSQKLDIRGNIALDNYSIISKGGSSVGFGSGGIGNEDDDITVNVANDGEFELNRAGVNLFSIGSHILLDPTNSKNIGIGTNSPSQKLDIRGNIALDNYSIISKGGSSVGFGSGGIGNEDDDITVNVANDGEFELNRAGVNLFSVGNYILIDRTNSKNIGIGIENPQNKLSVNGTIWATKMKVSFTDGADWVFEDEYELLTLEEVEEFVHKNKHLPGIPSAEEFRQNDLNVAEMDNMLLQKIEELTLYMIDMNKRVNELETENQELKEEISRLKSN